MKILRAPGLDSFCRLFLLAAEVFQVGLAIAAADDVQVEVDIGRLPFIESAGSRYWDHNFPNVASANNPFANYVLRNDLNGLRFTAP